MSSPHYINLPGYPFDSASFRIRPCDVSSMFVLDADFQRDVRQTKMIQNIQRTMLSTKQIDSRLILAEIDKQLIVIDGKHRLRALATLTKNVFVTMFADVYRKVSHNALPRIFEIHNATMPPSLNHLLSVHVRMGRCRAYNILNQDANINITTSGRKPNVGVRFLDIMRILSYVYKDCPAVTRFTLDDVESEMDPLISRVFCSFVDCFAEASRCPVGNSNFWWRYGWAVPLMRVFAQNQGYGIDRADWVDRFNTLFGTTSMIEFREKLSTVMFSDHLLRVFHRALNRGRQRKVYFTRKTIVFKEALIEPWISQYESNNGRPLAIEK